MLFNNILGGHSEKRRQSRILKGCTLPVVEQLESRQLLAGDGLLGAYYDNSNFTGATLSRIDARVNFDWGTGTPATGIKANTFSARWTGQVEVPTSGTYTFYTRADDGVRLWVNGVRLVNYWSDQSATERSGKITLQAGQRYDIRMDYYENTGSAVAQLRWSGPGIAKQLIPQAKLYSGAAAPAPTPQAPSPATGLQAVVASPNSVALSWIDGATNEQGWIVDRSSNGVNFTEVGRSGANAISYVDNSVVDASGYTYRVRSFNATGTSADAIASVTIPPNAPTALVASAVASGSSGYQVALSWTDNSSGENGYLVERSSDGGTTFTSIAALAANTTQYTDASAQAGSGYVYRVTATSQVGPSLAAQVVLNAGLQAPTNLTATPGTNTPRITLRWTDNSGQETAYQVDRSTDGVNYTALATLPANTTTYIDAGSLAAGTTYQYRLTALASGLASQAAGAAATTTGFKLFDSTLFSGRPDLSTYGIAPIYVAYDWEFFDGGDKSQPSETRVRSLARSVAGLKQILVIDIEHWPMDIRSASEAEVQETIGKFSRIISWIRSEAPGVQIGMYGDLPLCDFWTPIFSDANRTQAWQRANDFLAPLASQMDYLFPSLYTFYTNRAEWSAYAQANIAEARRYGKPVYPFLCMAYHDSNEAMRNTELPADYWRMELDTLRQYADGAVIWGGYQAAWNDSAPWWTETATFATAPLV